MKHFLIPILIFTVLIYGCDSVKTQYMDAEKIPTGKDREFQGGLVKLDGIFLKDGTYLDLQDKNPEVVLNGKAKEIHYDLSETGRGIIPIDRIASAKVDIVHGGILTSLAIIGGLALIALIIFFIALPHIGRFD